eukprot:11973359-Karenia_brevis.AAC.1
MVNYFGAMLRPIEAMFAHLGAMLGYLGAMLGHVLRHLEAMLSDPCLTFGSLCIHKNGRRLKIVISVADSLASVAQHVLVDVSWASTVPPLR